MHDVDANGIAIPALGFGTFQLEEQDARRMVAAALDIGYRHLDTAQIYGNEEAVGHGIRDARVPRNELFLTTKVWIDRFEPDDLHASVEESLAKLRTGYVDLLLLHWPNPDVPLERTLDALAAVREAKKTRAIGVSNFPSRLLRRAIEHTGGTLATNQVEYHVLLGQKQVKAVLEEAGMALTAYCPLAQGGLVDHPVLAEIGGQVERSPAQVALRWLIEQPGVSAIPRSRDEQHARENFALFDFELTSQQRGRLDTLASPDGRVVDPENLAPQWDPGAPFAP